MGLRRILETHVRRVTIPEVGGSMNYFGDIRRVKFLLISTEQNLYRQKTDEVRNFLRQD